MDDYLIQDDIFNSSEKSFFEEFCKNSYYKIKKIEDYENEILVSEFSLTDIIQFKILELASLKCDLLKEINENYEIKNFSVVLTNGTDVCKKINNKSLKKGWNIFYNVDTDWNIEDGGEIIIFDELKNKINLMSEGTSGRLLIVDNKFPYVIRPPLLKCNKFKKTIVMEFIKNES